MNWKFIRATDSQKNSIESDFIFYGPTDLWAGSQDMYNNDCTNMNILADNDN